jgi:hypothetical protein
MMMLLLTILKHVANVITVIQLAREVIAYSKKNKKKRTHR